MKFAFCFLTYHDIIHASKWEPYFAQNNVYIHPKQKNYVHASRARYVLPSLVETSWGDKSIVEATLLLLEQAIKDRENHWFVLCAEDSCPLKPYEEFTAFFEKQTLSLFHVMDETKQKTSQWWALNRADAQVLVQRKRDNGALLFALSKKYRKQALDELFFLNALTQYVPAYQYARGRIHYVKWMDEWTSKHPTVFNALLEEDARAIQDDPCWFIRKTYPTFQNQVISHKPTCVVVCVGSESVMRGYDEFVSFFANHAHLFLLIMDAPKMADPAAEPLKTHCVQAFHVVWNMAEKAMGALYDKFAPNYEHVLILKEPFRFDTLTYPNDASAPWDFVTRHGQTYAPSSARKKRPQPMIANVSRAQNEPISAKKEILCTHNSNYKIAFLFLVIDDLHYPDIWETYLRKHRDFVSVYCHAKHPDQTATPWLKEAMVSDLKPTGWGYIVDAYFSLLRSAMEDEDNMKFVVISESCLPLKSLTAFFNKMDADDYRTSYIHFMRPSSYDIVERIQNQPNYEAIGDSDEFVKHYARFCLSRYHVQKLLDAEPRHIEFFVKMHVGDEFFLTLLRPRAGHDFVEEAIITYDNWEDVQKEVAKLKKQIDHIQKGISALPRDQQAQAKKDVDTLTEVMNNIRKNPKTYQKLGQKDVDKALATGSFFWRKFPRKVRGLEAFYNPKNGALLATKKGGTRRRRKRAQTKTMRRKNGFTSRERHP